MVPNYSAEARDEPYTDILRLSKDAEDERLFESSETSDDVFVHQSGSSVWRHLHVIVLYIILLALCTFTGYLSLRRTKDPSLGDLYTPAKSAVEYHEHTFEWNFWDKGAYMGFPTDEKDRMWSDLYNFGTSAIPNEDAALLHDATVAVPGSKTESLVMLDAWHQLHCLNAIRKAFYPERWPDIWSYHDNGTIRYNTVEMMHVDHCIDHIRQSLMCFSDVSPTSFYFDPKQGNNPKPVGTHMCRNFEKVKEWALERRVMDFSMQAEILGMGHDHEHMHDRRLHPVDGFQVRT